MWIGIYISYYVINGNEAYFNVEYAKGSKLLKTYHKVTIISATILTIIYIGYFF